MANFKVSCPAIKYFRQLIITDHHESTFLILCLTCMLRLAQNQVHWSVIFFRVVVKPLRTKRNTFKTVDNPGLKWNYTTGFAVVPANHVQTAPSEDRNCNPGAFLSVASSCAVLDSNVFVVTLNGSTCCLIGVHLREHQRI